VQRGEQNAPFLLVNRLLYHGLSSPLVKSGVDLYLHLQLSL